MAAASRTRPAPGALAEHGRHSAGCRYAAPRCAQACTAPLPPPRLCAQANSQPDIAPPHWPRSAPACVARAACRKTAMLYTLALVLILCWALGLVTSYTLGGLIHLLLLVALVMVLVGLLSGRRAL